MKILADKTDSGEPEENISPVPNFFSFVDSKTSAEFMRLSSRNALVPGETLFLQGSEHSYTYVVQSGLVRTFYISEAGREVTLGYWSTGDTIGGPSLFGDGQHVWSAAASRHSEVFAISGQDLRKLADSSIAVMNWAIKVLEFKLRWMSVLFQIHGTERVHDRLAKLLLMMGEIYGDEVGSDIVIKHCISQTDLASLVGASRQWTNQVLAKLRSEGIISMDGQRILIRDSKALRKTLEKTRWQGL